jgi:hypothetical protein
MTDFTVGEQPCQDYKPGLGIHGFANVHECFGPFDGRMPRVCYGRVSNCENCHTDHHSGGYETCGKTPIPHVKTARGAQKRIAELEAELAALRWMLNYIRTSAGGEATVATAESRWDAREEES